MVETVYDEAVRMRVVSVGAMVRGAEERGQLRKILCVRCDHGTVFRRVGALNAIAHCGRIGAAVPPDLAECSGFSGRHEVPLEDLIRVATPIDKRVGVNDNAYR